MIIIFQFTELLASFIEAYIGFRFIQLLNQTPCQYAKKRTLLLSALLTILTFALNKNDLFSYLTILCNIIFICVSSLVAFRINFFKSFSIASFYFLFINLLDFLYITIIGAILQHYNYANYLTSGYSYPRFIFICIVKLLLIISYLTFSKLFDTLPIDRQNSNYLLILPITGLFGTLYLIRLTFLSGHTAMFYWIIFAIITTFIFSVFLIYKQYCTEKENRAILEIRNQLMEERYSALNECYSTNAALYHDLHNNLTILNNLIETENYDKAKSYMEELIVPINQIANTVYTGNSSIDFILNYKKSEALKHQITFTVNAEFSSLGHINNKDICTILFNLIDNAIEGCLNIVNTDMDKWITVVIRPINSMMIIKIENSCNSISTKNGLDLKTTKQDKRLHGLGLKQVSSTVEKYNGLFDYSCNENTFSAVISLF